VSCYLLTNCKTTLENAGKMHLIMSSTTANR